MRAFRPDVYSHNSRSAMKAALAGLAVVLLPNQAAAHSSLITPKPRNAIDSELPQWAEGNAPYMWVPGIGKAGAPCACKNGTSACASAQTCLWFSVGCSIGCAECDGATKMGANPNRIDRCGAGMRATNNDPATRTINRRDADVRKPLTPRQATAAFVSSPVPMI